MSRPSRCLKAFRLQASGNHGFRLLVVVGGGMVWSWRLQPNKAELCGHVQLRTEEYLLGCQACKVHYMIGKRLHLPSPELRTQTAAATAVQAAVAKITPDRRLPPPAPLGPMNPLLIRHTRGCRISGGKSAETCDQHGLSPAARATVTGCHLSLAHLLA